MRKNYLTSTFYCAVRGWLKPLAGAAVLLASSFSAQAQPTGKQQAVECTSVQPNGLKQADQLGRSPFVVNSSNCEQYPEYGPVAYEEQGLPAVPIQTVRIMFHVFQKADGSGNWQAPAQDGGADEALLRGLVDGIAHYPTPTSPTSPTLRGLNGIYSHLDERETASMGHTVATPAQGAAADSRIRFQLMGIRYYRDPYFYDFSTGSVYGCGDEADCLNAAYEKYVTNSTASQDLYKANPRALTSSEKAPVMHIFFGENPGLPSTRVDQLGSLTSRYGAGGFVLTVPGAAVRCRGLYWTIKQHPYYAAGSPLNTNPFLGVKYAEYTLAHELGHALGLNHTDWDACVQAPFNDPPARLYPGETNNIMDGPDQVGFSLSQCQIGKMHYYLTHAGEAITWRGAPAPNYLDNMVVEDYCKHDPSEDVTIKPGMRVEWNSAHNLRGNLYIERDASLTVRCRVGFVGPEAKIVVREGGELILDNGTIGNYAVSDVRECNDDLLLWLGGDGSDGDNGGLINIRNGGGFASAKLNAVLVAGATLHVEPVAVSLDGCRLTTQSGSFLCVEPGATFTYARQARFDIDPGTILGINPAINLQATCQNKLCDVLSQTVGFTASTVHGSGANSYVEIICPGSPVTMSASGAQSGSTTTVTWYKDNVAVSSSPDYTDAPTGAAGATTVVYRAEITFGNGCPPVTWSFTQPVAPASSLSLLANSATICAAGTGANYTADGWFILNNLHAALRDPNDPANQNMLFYWQDPAMPDITVLRRRRVANGVISFQLNAAALRAQGITSYPLQLCNEVVGAPISCPTCATITINLTEPAFTVAPPALACAGKPVTLSASGPSGATYTWTAPGQPTLTGSSVTASLSQNTTYTVVGEVGGCRATRQVTVNVQPATCLSCLSGPTVKMNANSTTAFSAYTFVAGTSYLFSQDTEFNTGTFLVPEGATLLFDAGVVLTLRNGALLDLRGGELTATCEEMWGGIVAEASSGGVVSNKPLTVDYSIISHSYKGLTVLSDAYTQPALKLSFVAFRHNGQSMQVTHHPFNSTPFAGSLDNCDFDSDPLLMRKRPTNQPVQEQYVSRHHLALSGNCANLVMSNSTLNRALVAIWVPEKAPFVAKKNIISNFYVAGIYSHDLLPATTMLTDNQFVFPQPANGILTGRGPQVSKLYDEILNYEGPTAWLREGVCVGIYGHTTTTTSVPNFKLEYNHFKQPIALAAYNDRVPFPQYGVIIDGGEVQHNTFESLQIGYLSRSTQVAGLVRDNLFRDCVYGVFFTNGQQHATPGAGDALVTCNTFERLPNVSGTSVGIMRDFCQRQQSSDPCDQVNFSTVSGTNILQKNKFVWPNSNTYDHFYHIFNSSTNARIDYMTFDNPIASSIVVNDPALVRVVPAGVSLVASTSSAAGNDCDADGFTQYGLRGTAPSVPGTSTAPDKPSFMAQNVPNPCSGHTSVSYRTPPGSGEAQLVVRTYFSGAVVLRQGVPAGEHTVDLKLDTLPAGCYHYALEIGGKPVAHHNLLVQ